MVHGLSHSEVCEIFPDQRLNPCLLHWQADSLPLSDQGSPPLVGLYGKESVMNLLSPALENVIRGLVMHGLLEFISSPREV